MLNPTYKKTAPTKILSSNSRIPRGGMAGTPISQSSSKTTSITGGLTSGASGRMGGSSSSSVSAGTRGLTSEYQKAFNEAKAANENRYGQVLQGYKDLGQQLDTGYGQRYDASMAALEGAGASEKAAIEQKWKEKGAADQQDMVSMGMYNTTVKPTVAAQNTRGEIADTGALQERINQQKLGVMGQLSGDRLSAQERMGTAPLNTMENRTDAYPDQGMYLEMMKQSGYGSAGAKASTGESHADQIARLNQMAQQGFDRLAANKRNYSSGGSFNISSADPYASMPASFSNVDPIGAAQSKTNTTPSGYKPPVVGVSGNQTTQPGIHPTPTPSLTGTTGIAPASSYHSYGSDYNPIPNISDLPQIPGITPSSGMTPTSDVNGYGTFSYTPKKPIVKKAA